MTHYNFGICNVKLGFRQVEENHLMENIIYNELRKRGYRVDFVASRGSQKYYLQSAFALNSSESGSASGKFALVSAD